MDDISIKRLDPENFWRYCLPIYLLELQNFGFAGPFDYLAGYKSLMKTPTLIWLGAFKRKSLVGQLTGVSIRELEKDEFKIYNRVDVNFDRHDTLFVENFSVAPKLQSNGVGRKLIGGIAERSKDEQYEQIAMVCTSNRSRQIIHNHPSLEVERDIDVSKYCYFNEEIARYVRARII